MHIYTSFNQNKSRPPLALSLGMFDGVHRGHQSILNELNIIAEQKKLQSAVLTFWPHPRMIFQPDITLKLLNTIEEKSALLEKFGVDHLFLQNFDENFRNLTGEEFVKKVLVESLNVKYLTIGYDHVFGKNKSGNFELLQKLAPKLGFEVVQMEAVNLHNNTISSTKIRKALDEGKIGEANEMLGYAYPVTGKVVKGKQIGRTIGFPTANIEFAKHKLLPKKGAYIVETYIDGDFYKGMLSVGTNPTVNGDKLTVEVFILDFNEDLYDKEITVKFREFLHDEIKFDGLEKLIERLKEDKRLTESFRF